MNDRFLHDFRKEPPPSLMETVYGRIAMLPGTAAQEQAAAGSGRGRQRAGTFALAGVAILLFLVASSFFSPTVRALVEDVVSRIGGLAVRETAVYPHGDEETRVTPANTVTLAEAREMVDYEFALPSAVPERYTMLDEVIVSSGGGSVLIRWRSETVRGDGLSLFVFVADPDVQQLVGSNSVETIQVNDQEAQFIRGGWNADSKRWDPNISRQVRWLHDGLEYQLSTGNPDMCPGEEENRCPLSDQDLMDIAASVP